MKLQRIMWLSVIAVTVFGNILSAQYGSAPTAEDVLKALLHRRPMNEVIPPVGVSTRDLQKNKRKLLPEGWTIIERTGRLEQQGNWWTFVFDPPMGDLPSRILPNAKLEQMVRTTIHANTIVIFTISTEVTVFQGENYLLVRMAMRPPDTIENKTMEPSQPDQKNSIKQELTDKSAGISIDASAEDVLEKMKNLKPTQSLVGFQETRLIDERLREATLGRTMIADGTSFIRRSGRLYQQSDWWHFAPESDHPDYPEPPMRLLPNKNTERMVRAWEQDSIGLVFIVSGEVTLFRGENYLLPGVAVRQIDSGNLRK